MKTKSIIMGCVGVMLALGGILPVRAQELRWGPAAALNLSRPLHNVRTTATGFNVGVRAELGLKKATAGLYVDGAMLLTSKPLRSSLHYFDANPGEDPGFKGYEQYAITPYYMEFPFHVGYKFRVCGNVALFPSVGPYVAFGLFGSDKWTYMPLSEREPFTVSYGNPFKGGGLLRRVDAGLTMRFGAEFMERFQIAAEWKLGMVEMRPFNHYNHVAAISAAYMF